MEKCRKQSDKKRKKRIAPQDVVQQEAKILTAGAENDVHPVASLAEKVIAAKATIVLHVTDQRLDGGAALTETLETGRKMLPLVPVANMHFHFAFITVATIASVHEGFPDAVLAAQALSLSKTVRKSMPVVGIVVKAKRAEDKAFTTGGHKRRLVAEFVFLV